MKKGQYSVEKIIVILGEAESGVPVKEICRKYGFAENTFKKQESFHVTHMDRCPENCI